MFRTLLKHWHIFWKFRRLTLSIMAEYRTDFFFWMGISLMWTAFNYFFFGMLASVRGFIAGWSTWEMYALLSVYTMVDAFTWSVMARNMSHFTRSIFDGSLSQHLLRPVDLQFLMMTQSSSYNNIPRFIIGLIGVVYSLNQLNVEITVFGSLLFSIAFLAGLTLMYSLWFILATCAFWVEKLDNINDIIPSLRHIWQVPPEVYQGFISTLFTFIVPLSLITALPSGILLGKYSYWFVLYFVCSSVVFFAVSRVFLHFSLRRYGSVGG